MARIHLAGPAAGPAPAGLPVAGTGFLVGPDLLVTCAHVLESGPGPTPVRVCFPQAPGRPEVTGRFVPGTWRAPEAEDVVFLRLDPAPAGIPVLGLRSVGPAGDTVRAFGFPAQAPVDGHPGTARVGERFTAGEIGLLGLTEANALAQGFSGSPLVDADGLVIGMVTAHPGADRYARGVDLAYATPAAVLQAIGPGLRVEPGCPYPGLVPFTPEQARWFHGRDHVVEELLERLRARRGVLALFGSSGSGKSSLVAAGLPPALSTGALPGVSAADLHLLRAGTDPAAVIEALAQLRSGPGRRPGLLVVDQFEELLTEPVGRPPGGPGEPEIPDGERVLAELVAFADGDRPGRVLLVMRDDFFPQLSGRSPALMKHLLQERIVSLTDELDQAALRDIVTGPARRQGWNVDPLLTDRLIRDLVDPRTQAAPAADLPVLALTLRRIWDTATAGEPTDNTLTSAHYDTVGGVRTAFAGWCDQAYRELPADRQPTARDLVTALVQDPDPGQGTPAVRRRRTLAELTRTADGEVDAAAVETLEHLTDARIVTTTRDPAGGEVLVELAHDTVIEHWDALHTWLEDDRERRRWLDRTEDRAQHWLETGRRSGLLEDDELGEAARYAGARVPDVVAAYLTAGRVRQRARIRARHGVQLALVALTLFSLVAATVAVVRTRDAGRRRAEATQARTEALRQRDVAIGNQALDFGDQLTAADPSLAAQLDLVGYRLSPSPQSAARLRDLAQAPLAALVPGRTGTVTSVAFSPDGRILAGGNDEGDLQLWSRAGVGPPVALGPPFAGRAGAVATVAFSPDGATLAAGGGDGVVRRWTVSDPRHPVLLGRPLAASTTVESIAFSPDGRTLAAGDDDGRLRLWDLTHPATPELISRLSTGGLVYAVAFSPDGRILAGAGDDAVQLWDLRDRSHPARSGRPSTAGTGTTSIDSLSFSPDGRTLAGGGTRGELNQRSGVRLWDVHDPAHPAAVGAPLAGADRVAFSPDGRTLATSDGPTVRRWDLARPARPAAIGRPLTGHTSWIVDLAFSPDGRTLATSGQDNAIRLWNLTSPAHPDLLGPPLTGPTGDVESVAVSPDGRDLISAGDDRTVRQWDLTRAARPGRVLLPAGSAGPAAIMSLAYRPDGQVVAAGGADGRFRLWDLTGAGDPVLLGRPVDTGSDSVTSVAFSPDGRTLAVGTDGRSVSLWDVGDAGRPVRAAGPLRGPADVVDSVAFSRDGSLLAAGVDDGTVQVWTVTDPARPGPAISLKGTQNDGIRLAFGPRRLLAAVDDGGTLRLWNLADPALPVLAGPPESRVDSSFYAVAVSPDGRTLAVGDDTDVQLWDLSDPAAPTPLGRPSAGHTGTVTGLAFSPDGRTLAGAGDRTVRLRDLDVDHAVALICATTSGNLDRRQWARYLPQLPYDPPCGHLT